MSLNKKRYTYDFNSGELLKEQEGFFGSNIHGHYLTYDQKYWIVLGQSDAFDGYGWSNFDSPDEPFEQAGRALGTCYVSLTYRAPIYGGYSKGMVVDMPKGTKYILYLLPNPDNARANNVTLYNVQAEDLERSY